MVRMHVVARSIVVLAALGALGLSLAGCPGGAARGRPGPAAASAEPRGPVTLTYLGVAGWQIEGGGHTILVDPYFSRPDLDGPIASDPAAVAARSPARADLIVIGHTHVDHALDAAAVAQRTGAQLLGSDSTAMLARAQGLADDRIITVKGGEDFAFDGFSVRVIPGLHSALGDKHVFGRPFAAPPTLPMTMNEFAEGGTFNYLIRIAGHQIVVIGSANYIERELDGLRPDILIVGTGLRQEIHDYTCRLVGALGAPPRIYADHFDDWQGPPIDEPISDDLRAFMAEVEACAPDTDVVIPRHFAPMIVP